MKAKIFTQVAAVMLFMALLPGNAQELLTDGGFDTTAEIPLVTGDPSPDNAWYLYQSPYVTASAYIESGICVYNIPADGYPGDYAWEIQLIQSGFVLQQTHMYRLSYDVMADAERDYGLFLGEAGGNWNSLIGYDKYTQYATTEWKTVVIDFKTTLIFPYHKLSFEVGAIPVSMYFDNVSLTDMGPYTPSVGILGSSLSGWDNDVDMQTADGINYAVQLYLATGRVKFRQDDLWWINWGGTEFPAGTGSLYGSDIMVTNPGTYDITFNRETLEYSFTCVDNCSAFLGIAGTAVPPWQDWNTDVNMITYDGITYMMTAYQFTDGEAKFRKNDSWTENWSNNTFPSGTAIPDGPPIPVTAGNYKVTFNILTGEYNFAFPSIGILGDALPGWWYDDIDLTTTDGIIYTLTDYPFNQGEVKFRMENEWDVNWGDYGFPTGYGYQDGPNIQVPAGTYTVTFNRLTGEYAFMATTCQVPGIICPSFIYAPSDPGICGAWIYYPDVMPAPNCGGEGVTMTQTTGLPSGSFFPAGMTTNTFVLTNAEGATATCSFDVYVWDNEAPVVSGLKENYDPLWPPDHNMVQVPLDYQVYDNCGSTECQLYVWSSEPDNGTGDGDTAPDWEIIDGQTVMLRAERSGTGTGREYHIIIECRDMSWNFSYNEIVVKVPHDINGKAPFITFIWPNPTDYNFNLQVESDSDNPIQVSVSDATGRVLSKYQVRNNETISFGSDLMPGSYFVIVKQGSNSETILVLRQ
ncbi:MAG TPA: SusF/SusE family outer membrane protein [Bacteroidales bacterium]|jgi:hypothetical protein|nr:SusF/SusE family outer membrane protein [Bacteroidales bacterium]HNX84062.1 SusF/SusE family outer membrane protein [Bacteroidales bacterium]